MVATEVIPQFMGIRRIPLPGSLWKLADRTALLLSMLLLSPQMTPRSRLSSTLAVAQFRVGSLSQAAKRFCAGGRNCRIRCIASRHGSPAALLDDRSPVPCRNLVELDQFRRCIGLVLELLDADRSQHRYDRGFGALGCHSLSCAAECPSERRESDNRDRNSTGHCTPYRWFHPGMDLHFVTLALGEANFSCFTRGIISSGEPASVRFGNYSDYAGAARLSDWRTVLTLTRRRGAAHVKALIGASRCDGGPDCAMPCRQ